ncbi:MAG: carbamate kinase, partial [Marmoricola sp.]
MRIVIALGGNALLRRGERPDAAPQLEQVAKAAGPLAALAQDHEVVIVHGNGPQVGLLALESAADESLSRPYPLGDLVAETQGLIGYWLQQAIGHTLSTPVVTLVSQTVVEVDDPAFANPTKFVGSVYDELEAKTLATEHDWSFARDGDAWRRVVASPTPVRVVETATADMLLRSGVTVVLAGGGGVPVIQGSRGLEGIEAVVDKDLVAALVAEELRADLFVVLTDVPAVMVDFGTPQQRPLRD